MTGMTAEEIGFEQFVAGLHVCFRYRIEQTVPGVVDPDIDSFEVVQSQSENAVNLLGVANVAGQRGGAVGIPDPKASGFGPRGVPRQQNDARSFFGEDLGNCLADAHRSTRNHHDPALEFHDRVVFSATRQVKMRSGAVALTSCRTIGSFSSSLSAVLAAVAETSRSRT
jgi:hypothetical protein